MIPYYPGPHELSVCPCSQANLVPWLSCSQQSST
ncbi:unnamed protein product [Staurois parvus]|uniref:Uncharacterized protein n=1 Tax=Staurois parvus TaxID=386267 RepID=A0ABN9G1H0_9NEOB|nr:unnamed protein product [Staurois parvus]